MNFTKLIGNYISIPLTYLFNKCITIGYFPNGLKITKVIVIHKSGKKDNMGNYRPISLLPQMSKILEQIIKERLQNYINKHNILIDNQFGFRVGRSTAHAVDRLIDSISNKLDNTYKYLTVSIDPKKAFDTLDNGILLKKLSNFGIRGISVNLLHSYLTNRKQYVSYHNVDSNLRSMNIGIP